MLEGIQLFFGIGSQVVAILGVFPWMFLILIGSMALALCNLVSETSGKLGRRELWIFFPFSIPAAMDLLGVIFYNGCWDSDFAASLGCFLLGCLMLFQLIVTAILFIYFDKLRLFVLGMSICQLWLSFLFTVVCSWAISGIGP
jgi:hypothetical protein